MPKIQFLFVSLYYNNNNWKSQISLEPLRDHQKTISFSEELVFDVPKSFPSPYRQQDDVRTSGFSELETAIDALERQKSHSVHFRRTG